ncbi:hypothetical protein [Xylella taiwanensis]|nr:hypothetical protein [Xylella taiwanensis]MCD8455546.1 hypothetical protein [Xylella taiwanensis]MCD8463853.1 hypothetical protein [Xylella taiwanensis]UFN20503.1 hypothetical protein LPH58_00455 [Xylella taiwanensis]UFN40346.1 hypothetical protein LPH57_06250 [Xylella taiwanensis]UFS52811.1 hypothetical protein LPH56_05335 [Xylella taiwanensis]
MPKASRVRRHLGLNSGQGASDPLFEVLAVGLMSDVFDFLLACYRKRDLLPNIVWLITAPER